MDDLLFTGLDLEPEGPRKTEKAAPKKATVKPASPEEPKKAPQPKKKASDSSVPSPLPPQAVSAPQQGISKPFPPQPVPPSEAEIEAALTVSGASTGTLAILNEALRKGRLPHALLVSSESLEAAERFSLALAARILKTVKPSRHPDFHELRPQKKARMINIGTKSDRVGGEWPENTMRRLIADLQLVALSGEAKVAFVFEADRMNHQTANAFLKTLEEPPASTTLILCTTRPYDLMPTIRSRCMNIRLKNDVATAQYPAWEQWLTDYAAWVIRLSEGGLDKTQASGCVVHLYGLLSRFETLYEEWADAAWTAAKTRLPEGIAEDTLEATEAGYRKSIRASLFRDIEEKTWMTIRKQHNMNAFVIKTYRALGELDAAYGLLELNFHQTAALEQFLLQSLHIWAR